MQQFLVQLKFLQILHSVRQMQIITLMHLVFTCLHYLITHMALTALDSALCMKKVVRQRVTTSIILILVINIQSASAQTLRVLVSQQFFILNLIPYWPISPLESPHVTVKQTVFARFHLHAQLMSNLQITFLNSNSLMSRTVTIWECHSQLLERRILKVIIYAICISTTWTQNRLNLQILFWEDCSSKSSLECSKMIITTFIRQTKPLKFLSVKILSIIAISVTKICLKASILLSLPIQKTLMME